MSSYEYSITVPFTEVQSSSVPAGQPNEVLATTSGGLNLPAGKIFVCDTISLVLAIDASSIATQTITAWFEVNGIAIAQTQPVFTRASTNNPTTIGEFRAVSSLPQSQTVLQAAPNVRVSGNGNGTAGPWFIAVMDATTLNGIDPTMVVSPSFLSLTGTLQDSLIAGVR